MTSYTIIFDNVHLISYLWPFCANVDFEIQLYLKFIHNITVSCLTIQYHVIDKTMNTEYAFFLHKYMFVLSMFVKKNLIKKITFTLTRLFIAYIVHSITCYGYDSVFHLMLW